MEKTIEKQIMAIVPKYISNKGNCTIIYTEEGIVEIEKSIKTVIKNISKYYHFDLKESNSTYRKLLYCRKNPPVPFTKKDIFILVKTRKPIGKHDGAYGYIRIDSIENIEFNKKEDLHPRIIFKNGQFIQILCTLDTLHKNIKNGEIVKKLLNSKYENRVKERGSLYLDENKPATKADIALLFMEINKLQIK